MATIDISCHSVEQISATQGKGGGITWIDLTVRTYDGKITVTLFPADHADPRFAALAEFIATTWPEAKPVEAAPAVDETDLPF